MKDVIADRNEAQHAVTDEKPTPRLILLGQRLEPFYSVGMKAIRDLMRTYAEYTHWANVTILAACTACSDEILESNQGASHGSLLDTLRHTYLSDLAWRNRILSGQMPGLIEMARPEQYSGASLPFTIADLKEHWPQVTKGLMEWLERVSDAELNEVMFCDLPSGESLKLTRAEVLLHDLNHGTVHRGQALGLLRAVNVQPPNIDVFSYYMHRMHDVSWNADKSAKS